LALARETANLAAQTEGRSRKTLYEAIGFAWGFAQSVENAPEDYAELLDEAGLTVSPRSPMTAIAKLVFGAGYDKTRLAEITTVLRYAEREAVEPSALPTVLDRHAGGIKGLVKAERQRSRPDAPSVNRAEAARDRLRTAAPLADVIGLASEGSEFEVVVVRRNGDGEAAVVARLSDAVAEQILARLG
jgi:hypothetical protein